MNEIRITLRSLARAPLLAAATVLTIAIAIGGAVAVFALLDAALLRSLPYPNADRLVAVWADWSQRSDEVDMQDPRREWTNTDNHRDLRDASASLADVAVFTAWIPTLTGGEQAQNIEGLLVTWSALQVLGINPVLGRGFEPADDEASAEPVVVVTEGFRRRHFAGEAEVLGRSLVLNGEAYTLVGVLPAGFRFPFVPEAEVIAPLRMAPGDRAGAYLRQFGRLADGVTLAQAQAELDTISAALQAEYPAENRALGWYVEPLQQALNLAVRPQLILLQLAALFVLVVALANLASLMVARATARAGDFAVRAALGATVMRQFRLLWLEGLALAVVGAVLGLLVARFGISVLSRVFPEGFTEAWDVRIGIAEITVAAGSALLAGSAIAIASLLALGRGRNLVAASSARVTGARGGRRLAGALVASNFAVALAVTVTGMLLFASSGRLATAEPGYRPDGVVAAFVNLSAAGYPDEAALSAGYERLQTRLLAIPGVEHAALATVIPLGRANTDTSVQIEGQRTARSDGRAHVWFSAVTAGFFETLGIRVQQGRAFTAADRSEGRSVAVVNAAFVREYFADRPALGVRIATGPEDEPRWFDIVGVVEDVRQFDMSRPATPMAYFPAWILPSRNMYITLRAGLDPDALAPALRHAVAEVDATVALADLRSMPERIDAVLTMPRAVSRLTLLFAACALLLAGIGVYGALAQGVAQRSREFGLRRAFGALDRHVFALVLRQGAWPVALGFLLGLPLTLLLGNQLRQVLYQVSPLDAQVWASAAVVLLAVAFCAAAVPGRRATRIPPMEALREE
jgi:putative ABC transport system permease protein